MSIFYPRNPRSTARTKMKYNVNIFNIQQQQYKNKKNQFLNKRDFLISTVKLKKFNKSSYFILDFKKENKFF